MLLDDFGRFWKDLEGLWRGSGRRGKVLGKISGRFWNALGKISGRFWKVI